MGNKISILAIDPGPEQSGWCLIYGGEPLDHGTEPNAALRDRVRNSGCEVLVLEMVDSYGMPVGRDVFETVYWIGRFAQAFPGPFERITRRDIKLHHCGSSRAKDANIRQAVIDRYPRAGGGKTPQIGTKSEPGPLYGVSGHVWAALAAGLTYHDALTGESHARRTA
jgi:hypothetical protein